MDFFERQDRARRQTKWLVLYFIAGVVLTILAVYIVVSLIFGQARGGPSVAQWWNPELFLGASVGTLAVIFLGSLYKTAQLSGGGSAVASALGGRPINPQTTDLDEQKLRNVVEEMAIASGVPVPEIYVLDDEPGINAFAAGHSTSDAAIGVTRGALRLLGRDELQGVIGHEFSHILNGDMRLNLRLMGWVFGILCLTIIGRILLRTGSTRSSRRDKKGGNPLPILGLGLIVIGFIGVFFGKLIKAAVSRQREYLADAAAVQFTRNPSGLAGALKKIGGLAHGSRLEAPNAEEASHMFFGNGMGEAWLNAFATHPPLAERIRLLEPQFDGNFSKVVAERKIPTPPPIPQHARTRTASPPPKVMTSSFSANEALADVGRPTTAHLSGSAALISAIPARLIEAVHEPFGATAVIYSLLIHVDPQVRTAQLVQLNRGSAQLALREIQTNEKEVRSLDQRLKLPLVELALPALRQLSPAQYTEFAENVTALIAADKEMDLFEYALRKMLFRHLEPHFGRVRKPIVQYYALNGLGDECAVLLSALAHAGHAEPAAIEKAFRTSVARLNIGQLDLLDLDVCTMERIDGALDRLAQAAPPCKKPLLDACAHSVAADGALHIQEAELLRAIADSLDCPMPPFMKLSSG